MLEAGDSERGLGGGFVFEDDAGVGTQQGRVGCDRPQHWQWIQIVRRVHKDNIKGLTMLCEPPECQNNVPRKQFDLRQAEGRLVARNNLDGRCCGFDQQDPPGAAAGSLEADGARACEEIEPIAAGCVGLQNIKKGLFDLARRRAGGQACQSVQVATTVGASNDFYQNSITY